MAEKAVLLYAGRCPKCRFLSALLVKLSLGSMRRVPLERDEARQFYRVEHPEAQGLPALSEGERFTFGWRVFFAVPRLILQTWWGALTHRNAETSR
jgi:predicted DCC family thiol-disulfide oxidoreductase YuxK